MGGPSNVTILGIPKRGSVRRSRRFDLDAPRSTLTSSLDDAGRWIQVAEAAGLVHAAPMTSPAILGWGREGMLRIDELFCLRLVECRRDARRPEIEGETVKERRCGSWRQGDPDVGRNAR